MTSVVQRGRYHDGDGLVSALSPFVLSSSYLPACEKLTGRYVLLNAKDLVRELANVQANLSFSKKITEDAHKHIFDEKHVSLSLCDSKKEEWTKTMTSRLRTMCRFTSQAKLKKRPPSWVEKIWPQAPATQQDSQAGTSQTHGDSQPIVVVAVDDGFATPPARTPAPRSPDPLPLQEPSTAQYIYGFDPEFMMAWRNPTGDSTNYKRQELAEKMVAPLGSQASDAAEAVWTDGHRHPVAEVCVADLPRLGAREGAAVASKAELVGYTPKGLAIKLVDKPDRGAIKTIAVDGRQRCQIKVDLFENGDACKAFMVEVAQFFFGARRRQQI